MSKERQPKPYRLTFEELVQVAKKAALERGGHQPLLLAQGSKRVFAAELADLPATHAERSRWLFFLGFDMAQTPDFGKLEQVYLVSEAWMSRVDNGQSAVVPPSQHPDRFEVLLISSLSGDGKHTQVATLRMQRDTAGTLTGLQEMERSNADDPTATSPLLAAFVHGFAAGRGEALN
jgi:hypothetical protein